jgi:hypothetical protein
MVKVKHCACLSLMGRAPRTDLFHSEWNLAQKSAIRQLV